MPTRPLYPVIAILACVIGVPSCVTYTPISAPPLQLPAKQDKAKSPQEPIPVPPPIPDRVHISIEPNEEPVADEGGLQLITEYANAQRNIKMHNQKLNTNR